eukprot:gene28927-34908_t
MDDNVPLYAGTWGQEQRALEDRRRQQDGVHKSKASEKYITEVKKNYSLMAVKEQKKVMDNQYHKFKSLQQSGSAIITLPPALTEEEEANLSQSLSPSPSRGDNRLSTTIRDSYKPPYSAEVEEIPVDLSRTRSKILRSPFAPMARGRSGVRKEKGVSTSGLSGERLLLSDDPRTNTLAQRAWLYTDDPALQIKIAGRPKVKLTPEITQMSLQIGNPEDDDENPQARHDAGPEDVHYGRRFIVSGGVLTKSGYARSGVFLDDHDQEVRATLRVHKR